ncbi:alcohol dehydrogenase [Candidatus Aerophobetes bacterium Ae_b3a]|nr:MAG: alcohol dehydrogenase [Candidatus Aerophobetes bacterium Ae_b3a]
MRAVKLVGNARVEVVDVSKPKVKRGWVVVKVGASAICGSDLHAYFAPEGDSFTPGHEVAGEVAEVGEQVARIKPGDRVAINNMVSCGICKFCQQGDWIFCNDVQVIGGDIDGGDAEYVAIPERNCFPLPNDLSFGEGALLGDAVGTPYRAIKALGANGAHIVAVFGLGPVGLGALLILKFLNCEVLAVEVSSYRQKMAKKLGADMVVDPNEKNPVDALKKYTRGEGVDIAIDCAGKDITENQALDCVKKRGKVAFVGENKTAHIRPSDQFIRKELTVIGSWYFNAGEHEELIRLVRRGVKTEEIITHRFSLEKAQEAFSTFVSGESGKVIFVPARNGYCQE